MAKELQNKMNEEAQEMECKMCLDKIELKDAFILTNCTHIFHSECLERFLLSEIEKSKCPIECALPNCRIVITESDMH